MATRFSFGTGLLRALVSLVFLSGLVAEALSSQAATNVCRNKGYVAPSTIVAAGPICQGGVLSLNPSDSTLSQQMEIASFEAFGVALEDNDSIQILRVEVRERVLRTDPGLAKSTISSALARNLRPAVTPPLLV